jgi:hypothetical protein
MTHRAKSGAQGDCRARPGRRALATELANTAHSGAFIA